MKKRVQLLLVGLCFSMAAYAGQNVLVGLVTLGVGDASERAILTQDLKHRLEDGPEMRLKTVALGALEWVARKPKPLFQRSEGDLSSYCSVGLEIFPKGARVSIEGIAQTRATLLHLPGGSKQTVWVEAPGHQSRELGIECQTPMRWMESVSLVSGYSLSALHGLSLRQLQMESNSSAVLVAWKQGEDRGGLGLYRSGKGWEDLSTPLSVTELAALIPSAEHNVFNTASETAGQRTAPHWWERSVFWAGVGLAGAVVVTTVLLSSHPQKTGGVAINLD